MSSSLLGDEYDASSSSDDDASLSTSVNINTDAPTTTTSRKQLLPSADELFSSDTSSVLTTGISSVSTNKRKNDQLSRLATKAVKTETGRAARRPKIVPFAPPQLRRPNISTEDTRFVMENYSLSSWNTNKTLKLQRKAKESEARENI